MLVKLLRPSRIRHEAGEIVEVSPAEAHFLISVGSAEIEQEFFPTLVETPEEKVVVKKRTTKK